MESLLQALKQQPIIRWSIIAYKRNIGFIAAFLTITVYSMGLPSVQVLDGAVPEFELNSVRFLVQMIITSPFILYYRPSLWIPKEYIKEFVIYVSVQNVLNLCYYTAPLYLPLGTLEGVRVAVTIFCNLLAALVINGSTDGSYLAAAICIVGALLMAQPDFIFQYAELYIHPPTNWTSECKTPDVQNVSSEHLLDHDEFPLENSFNNTWIGYLLIVAAGFSFSVFLIVNKKIDEGVKFYVTVFLSGLINTVLSLIVMFVMENPMFPTTPLCISMLFLHSFATSQGTLTAAFCMQYISPVVFAVMSSLGLAFQMMYQYTFFKAINPGLGNWVEVLGAVLCVLGNATGPILKIIQSWKYNKANYDNINDGHDNINLSK